MVVASEYYIRDLSGLRQLEYLQIEGMSLNDDSFIGLEKLISLQLIQCFSTGDKLCFNSLNSLQILRIEELYFPIELKSLENLEVLIIDGMEKLEDIINVSESITYLHLSSFDIDTSRAEEFFSRVYLPNLVNFYMNYNGLTYLKEHWFQGSDVLLKELILQANYLKNLDFCQFDCLAQLEKLDLNDNRIEKLEENTFSKLKRLKWLNLSNNPFLELGSNKFLGLKNLEYLFLNRISERTELSRIEKDAFNGLTNLKKLYLDENNLDGIDPEAFSHTPKLKDLSLKYNRLESFDPKVFSYTPKLAQLKICENKMRFEENIFANLKHLKKIELRESDLEHINKDILEFLKKSNIEFIIK